MRRVLGDPPIWGQIEFGPQLPTLPGRHPDPLINFVASQIHTLENQVRTEAVEYRQRDLGPVVVRYAHHILDLTAGHRRVVMRFIDALDAGAPSGELDQLRRAVATIAATWQNKAHGWRNEWLDEPPNDGRSV